MVKIGVTFTHNIQNDPENNYIRTLTEFGGTPVTLYPGVPEAVYADIDGLLLTGGGDIHPRNFNDEYHPTLQYVDENRDALEIQLYQQKSQTDLPILGICRGVQVMSIAMQGTLYQDIPSQYLDPQPLTHKATETDAQHTLHIRPDTHLHRIIGKTTDEVNSAHHQALKQIGTGFQITAHAADGIVEAIENPDKPFVIGVQYHPERMLETEGFREHRAKLFTAFIDAAST